MDLIQWYCGECNTVGSWHDSPADSDVVAAKVARAHHDKRTLLPCDGSDLHWSVSAGQPEMYRAQERAPYRAQREKRVPVSARLPERRAAEVYEREWRAQERARQESRYREEARRLEEHARYAKQRAKQRAEQEERDHRFHAACERLDREERCETTFRKAMAPFERRELREALSESDCPYFSEPFTFAPMPMDADELCR